MRRNRVGVRLAALAAVAAVAMTAFAPAAAAAAGDTSRAEARFLSGSGGGTDFDTVAALEGVAVKRSGDEGPVKEANPLKGSVLGQSLPAQPDGVTIPLSQILSLGAANQYAKASPRAKAVAASGAVADSGAISTTGSKRFPANATFSLTDLLDTAQLPEQFKDQVSLDLEIEAINAVAAMNAKKGQELATKCADLANPRQCRDYNIAGGELTLAIPTLGELLGALEDAVGAGDLATGCDNPPAESKQVENLCNTLDELSKSSPVTVEPKGPSLQEILSSVADPNGDTGLRIDLGEGTITLDVAKVVKKYAHADINNLEPNTELVGYIAQALADSVRTVLSDTIAELSSSLEQQLTSSGFKVDVGNQTFSLTGDRAKPYVEKVVDPLAAAIEERSSELSGQFDPFTEQLGQLQDVITIHANVQDSPDDGVYRETALRIVLGKGAPDLSGGGLGKPATAASDGGALEINLAQAEVGASLGHRAPAKDVPAGTNPPTAGPDLPNTGAGTLDLPFLLLGLGLVTGGLWIVVYGRSERLDL